jgi:LAS superfamily LD-carboxypeptidase LdcB
MSRAKEKKNSYKSLIRWVILLVVLTVLSIGIVMGIDIYSRNALNREISAVNAANERHAIAYQVAKAEYENMTRTGQSKAWPAPPQEGRCLLDLSTYPLENAAGRTVSRQELLEGGLMLVNHWHSIPPDFSEQNIKSVREWTNSRVPIRDNKIRLFQSAADAIDGMIMDAALMENLKDFIIQNAFRTMDEQQELFDKQVQAIKGRNANMAESLVIEQAKKSVNYPGTSEYQTGFAFEMKLYNKEDVTITGMRFPDSDQGKWFNENCWKYGVVFRFPTANYPDPGTEDKAFITGNASKLNIYRYVGIAHATAMKILNMCLEEYIDYLIVNPHFAIYDNGKLIYEVYRQAYAGDDAIIQVPQAASRYVASIDNMGGVVTAFYYD